MNYYYFHFLCDSYLVLLAPDWSICMNSNRIHAPVHGPIAMSYQKTYFILYFIFFHIPRVLCKQQWSNIYCITYQRVLFPGWLIYGYFVNKIQSDYITDLAEWAYSGSMGFIIPPKKTRTFQNYFIATKRHRSYSFKSNPMVGHWQPNGCGLIISNTSSIILAAVQCQPCYYQFFY